MIPTIRESIEKAIDRLFRYGLRPGDPVYDDISQALIDLGDGLSLDEELTA